MSDFVMYAGIHKTGSSAIHKTLAANRSSLLDQGFFYPPSPGGFNNHHAFAHLVAQRKGAKPLYSPTFRRELRHWELDLWTRAVLAAERLRPSVQPETSVLVAAEQFSALARPKLLELFLRLRPYWKGRDPRALMWVREPVELFRSLALQRLKGTGNLVALPRDPLRGGRVFHVAFQDYFSVSPSVFLYDSVRYKDNSVVTDFLRALKPDVLLPQADTAVRANPSISAEAGLVLHDILHSRDSESDALKEARRFRLARQAVLRVDLEASAARTASRLTKRAAEAVACASRESSEYFSAHGAPRSNLSAARQSSGMASVREAESFESDFRSLDGATRIRLVFEIDDSYAADLRDRVRWAIVAEQK